MRILFILERKVNSGSIQAVANYVRAGDRLGHTIAVYGNEDPNFPDVRFSREVGAFDYVVFIFESKLHWMTRLQLARFLSSVPRGRRAILDADGMYNSLIVVDDYDRNHRNEQDRLEWLTLFDGLADKILQPTLQPLPDSRVIAVPFYGYDPAAQIDSAAVPRKSFDILNVGHNWWRWRELSRELLPGIEQVRAQLGDICFVGLWWDNELQSWVRKSGWELAFQVDEDWLRRLRIQVKPPVAYTQVIPTMSRGRVNILTQRPLLRHLKHLTSKYFEIFCADTVPLAMMDPDHAELVYGPAGRELTLDGRIGDKLLDALNRLREYREIVQEVRRYLIAHHSYSNRVRELVTALRA